MADSSSSSTSIFDQSNGTEVQPLAFRYIENQKWKKLRRMLKRSNGKEMCRERDDSGLTLLGMSLGFDAPLDIMEQILTLDPSQITATDFFGASPLHVACLNAASIEAVEYLLKFSNNTLADSRDKDERVPLHHSVECLCRNEIDFIEGTRVIKKLMEAAPNSIHCSDRRNDSPLDLVQLARMEVRVDSKEFSRLSKLYFFLRGLSVEHYKIMRTIWEGKNIAVFEKEVDGSGSVSTKVTQDLSRNSSHITNFSIKDTIGDMAISSCDDCIPRENAVKATVNIDKKQKIKLLKFWKK
jgi:hypothetical protein